MKVILDRMLWVPADKLDLSRIKSELTVYAEKYIGKSDEIPLYEVKEGYIGVPRRWGLKALRDLYTEVEDRTVFPNIDWPEIKWPDGWGFWKGQKETIDSMVKVFQSGTYGALLEAGCGGGKTLMATMIGQILKTPVLVMVHKGDLSQQWHDLAHGNVKDKKPALFPSLRLGHVQQDVLDYKNCHLVTAMAQTLYNKRDELPADFWNSFGLVIYDEGHRYPARTFETVMKLPNARYRLAISATWRRGDSLECVWHWHIGSVEAKLNIERLTGHYVRINWKTNLTDSMFKRGNFINRSALVNAIADNIVYNKWLVQQLHDGAMAGRKVLLVSDRVDQLLYIRKELMQMYIEQGKIADIGMYIGNSEKIKTSKAVLELAKKKQIILATYGMINEGSDIPELDTLIFGTPRSDIEQVVGRIQRKFGDKKTLLIVDPVFSTRVNQKMADKREEMYSKLGFTKQ